jgi:hypothetical protein
MKAYIAIALVAFAPTLALAQEPVGCDKFKWPLDKERALLSAPVKKVASGGKVNRAVGSAVEISLVTFADAKLPMAPERVPKDAASYAGFVRVDGLRKAGTYKISLSNSAWIDVVRAGKYVKSGEFSGAQGCEGIRKSVKFDLPAAPFIVQVTGVPASSIKLVITSDK